MEVRRNDLDCRLAAMNLNGQLTGNKYITERWELLLAGMGKPAILRV